MVLTRSESEEEQRHKSVRRAIPNSSDLRQPLVLRGDEWPLEESVMRIDEMIKEIPP